MKEINLKINDRNIGDIDWYWTSCLITTITSDIKSSSKFIPASVYFTDKLWLKTIYLYYYKKDWIQKSIFVRYVIAFFNIDFYTLVFAKKLQGKFIIVRRVFFSDVRYYG